MSVRPPESSRWNSMPPKVSGILVSFQGRYRDESSITYLTSREVRERRMREKQVDTLNDRDHMMG